MATMKLIKYRVEKFKSVMDSGWIECDDVTTLVGVNEAGKSNLLLALWKLNPAKGGAINFSDDMPVTLFSELREQEDKPKFIRAVFKITSKVVLDKIVQLSGHDRDAVRIVEVSKDYDGMRFISFPNAPGTNSIATATITEKLAEYTTTFSSLTEAGATEKGIYDEAKDMLTKAQAVLVSKTQLTKSDLTAIVRCFGTFKAKEMKSSAIRPFISDVKKEFSTLASNVDKPSPSTIEEVRKIVVANLPKFVYYSNYGNLDSEIYLPHVIENMERTDLTGMAEAKARTLKVLFEYVNLDPKEILKMGEDAKGATDSYGRQTAEPTENEIKEKAEKKKERDILLQSASSKLTRDFREWWNQGNYTFDFSADGKHFRIWVADEVRPERIVLENRSTGLQWFLSFYLVFLVESQDSHSGAILLLDEAGLSLHPLAQKDLSAFFNNLSESNQIINTTHSPFIVDTSSIDRAKVVYVDKDGYTVVSSDLRASGGKTQMNSVYAVHAALGLTISDVLLQGCRPVVVEGVSDQYYLNAIKLFLLSKNLISPNEEIVFVPAGGAKAVSSIASLLSAKNELPFVVLDADSSGLTFKANLEKNLYTGQGNNILTIDVITGMPSSEIEDIITYGEMWNDIKRMGNYLKSIGLINAHIALCGSMCYEWIILFYGIVCSGNAVILLDKDQNKKQLLKDIIRTDCSALFLEKNIKINLESIEKQLKNIVTYESRNDNKGIDAPIWSFNNKCEFDVSPGQTAVLVFTSGTTGQSKIVVLSHENICSDTHCFIYYLGNENVINERTVPILPTNHMYSIITVVIGSMCHGESLCFGGGVKYFSKNLKFFCPLQLYIVPMVVQNMYSKIWDEAVKKGNANKLRKAIQLSNILRKIGVDLRRIIFKEVLDSFGGKLRIIGSGGSYLDPILVDKYDEIGIELINGYGITECSPLICSNGRGESKRGSVGHIPPEKYCELKIVNCEIWVKGKIVFSEYYKDPISTENAFEEGWFKTGDLGYIDSEGFLFITGRKKNIIILSDGNNVSPEELENHLEKNQIIKTILVCISSQKGKEVITAYIYPNFDFVVENNIVDIERNIQEKIDKLNLELPPYKRIQRMELLEKDLEKTAIGKVKRIEYFNRSEARV